ncbi:MAG: hypothetical protein J6P44_01670 [Bacteroidales bacterium]|nr:hypothetical protein [Bacteroidales bacterium]
MKKLALSVALMFVAIGVYGQHKTKFNEESHKGQVFAVERNEYNAASPFGEEEKGGLITRSIAYFDMSGNLIKEIRYHGSKYRHLDTVFVYNNEMGRVSEILQLEAKGRWMENGVRTVEYWHYDTVMIEKYSYNASGKIVDISTYKRDYTGEMNLASKVKYEYSANSYTEKKYGEVDETSTYTNNGKKKVTKDRLGTVTYIYDNNYRLVSENMQTDIYDTKGSYKYIYNPQGDVITKQTTFTSRYKNGGHTDSWVYTYDNNKNWTVRKYYSDNNNAKEKRIETWTERKFTYIDNPDLWQHLIDSIQSEDLSLISYNNAKLQSDSIKRADFLAKAEKLRQEEQRQQELNRKFEEAMQKKVQQQQEEEQQLLSIAASTAAKKQNEANRQQKSEEKLLSIAIGTTKKAQIKQCYNKGEEIIFPYQTTSGSYNMTFDKRDVVKQIGDDAEYYISYDRSVFVCKVKDGKKYRYRIVYNGHPKYSIAKGDTWDLSEKCYKQFEEFLDTNN